MGLGIRESVCRGRKRSRSTSSFSSESDDAEDSEEFFSSTSSLNSTPISSRSSSVKGATTAYLGSDSCSVSSSSSKRIAEKKYKCTYENCPKEYHKPSLLQQHIRSHENIRPFKCSIKSCEASFLRNSHLKAHLESHKLNEEKAFKCLVCSKGFDSNQKFKRHEITHVASFKCTYAGCDETFYKKNSLRFHINRVHEPKNICKQCGKLFTRPYKLLMHLEKNHDITAYPCTFSNCFLKFKNWSSLQNHIKTDHPKLSCTQCGKQCVGESGLRMHMVIHNTKKVLKIWNCCICNDINASYHKKDLLINHYKEVHDNILPPDLIQPSSPLKKQKISEDINHLPGNDEIGNGDDSNNTNKNETKDLKVLLQNQAQIQTEIDEIDSTKQSLVSDLSDDHKNVNEDVVGDSNYIDICENVSSQYRRTNYRSSSRLLKRTINQKNIYDLLVRRQ
ncbi:Pzf1p ASCRUDRAFT_77668 [Ascoidea rubescens DSM 1968]|uniref:C2H2-type domain-containing protein n=1 Tax=Ascoidea rubescens DSM 1968 TaxID=1344418 RepID=A0A1D2VAQ3_9ASCO|nr:hypothetical protein ASCRUDRAFT_77668 [Ascoidea rubescens DSM 1968]ODV58655.1 hypothetical protein ASCRUDRAFT_77668 [Ascoidea rubescens DSM 1968]